MNTSSPMGICAASKMPDFLPGKVAGRRISHRKDNGIKIQKQVEIFCLFFLCRKSESEVSRNEKEILELDQKRCGG